MFGHALWNPRFCQTIPGPFRPTGSQGYVLHVHGSNKGAEGRSSVPFIWQLGCTGARKHTTPAAAELDRCPARKHSSGRRIRTRQRPRQTRHTNLQHTFSCGHDSIQCRRRPTENINTGSLVQLWCRCALEPKAIDESRFARSRQSVSYTVILFHKQPDQRGEHENQERDEGAQQTAEGAARHRHLICSRVS